MPTASAGAPSASSPSASPGGTSPGGGPRGTPERDPKKPKSLQQQLAAAQGELQTTNQARLGKEIADLTIRYSGDATLAERVARGRMARGFAASDPDFAGTLEPIQARISTLEEQIRKSSQRRATGTIGGSGETLG